MTMETDEPRKRRQYTIEDRVEILEAVDEVGVVKAARRHGVPQTTVSNWLHRDAAKVTATKVAEGEGALKAESTRKTMRRGPTATTSKGTAGLKATAAPKVAAPTSKR